MVEVHGGLLFWSLMAVAIALILVIRKKRKK